MSLGGSLVNAANSALGGDKDSPDLQPWARVGERMKKDYFPRTKEFANQFTADDLYSGTGLADQHNATTAAQRQQLDLTGRWNEQTRGAANSIEGFIDYDPNSPVNQMRRDSFADQAMTNFDRNIRPGIEDRGTFGGQFGGPQQALAIGAAGADTMRDINSFEADMANQDRDRALRATGMAGQIYANQNAPLMNKEAIGNRMGERDQLEHMDMIMQHEQPYVNAQRNISDIGNMYTPFSGLGYQGTQDGGSALSGVLGLGVLANEAGAFDDFSLSSLNPFSSTTPPYTPSGGGGNADADRSGNQDWYFN